MTGPAPAQAAGPLIRISLAWASGTDAHLLALEVPAGCRLGEALALAVTQGLPAAVAGDPMTTVAVFGRLRGPDHGLADGDRIELLGPLQVDPKVARERRVAHKRAQQAQASEAAGGGRSRLGGRGPRSRLSGPGTRPGSPAPESADGG